MTWESFVIYAIGAGLCWIVGAYLAFRNRQSGAIISSSLGIVVFGVFIAGMWMGLERPPLRTMGEARLWYSFFLAVIGLGL